MCICFFVCKITTKVCRSHAQLSSFLNFAVNIQYFTFIFLLHTIYLSDFTPKFNKLLNFFYFSRSFPSDLPLPRGKPRRKRTYYTLKPTTRRSAAPSISSMRQ